MKKYLLLVLLILGGAGTAIGGTDSLGDKWVQINLQKFRTMANSVSNIVLDAILATGRTNTVELCPSNYSGAVELNQIGSSFSIEVNLKPGYENPTFYYYTSDDKKSGTFSGGAVPMPDSDSKGYGTWITNFVVSAKKFTVTFDPTNNGKYPGAQVSETTREVTYGSRYGDLTDGTYKELPVPTLTGYTFNRWNFEGTTKKVKSTSTVKILTSTNFVATWKPITYQIAFDANDGTGTMEKMTNCTYDAKITLPTCAFTREHFNFVCWSNTVTAQTYADQAKVSNLTNVQDAVATLTAVWTPQTYTVRYHSNYGSGTTTERTVTWDAVFQLKESLGRLGYVFKGWSMSSQAVTGTWAGNEEVNSSKLTFDDNGVCDLYGIWKAHTYTISFNANGGTGAMDNAEDRHTDDGKALPNCAFTRAGYVFAGWGLKKDDKTASFDEGSTANITMDDATVTLFALWTPIAYTLAFDGNSELAEGAMEPMALTYDVKTNLTACAFTRDGYDFNGWTNAVGTAFKDMQEVTNLTVVADSTVTLYATWKAQSYTVTLNANGGTFAGTGLETTNLTVTVDEPWGEFPAVTNADWKLLHEGWTTNANWSLSADDGTRVKATDLVPSPSKGVTTLFATWTKDDPLAKAVDATELDFDQKALAGTGKWENLKADGATNGTAAVASVSSGASPGGIEMSTYVVGPGTLTFRWKMTTSTSWPGSTDAVVVWSGQEDDDKPIDGLRERLWLSVNATGIVGIAEGKTDKNNLRFARFTNFAQGADASAPPTPSTMELLKNVAVGWTNETVRIESAAHVTNTITWTYHSMYPSGSVAGQAFAWVDAVVWTPDDPGAAGEPEVPVAAEGASAPIAIEPGANGAYTIKVAVGNGVKGCWYAVYQADEVTGPWTLVNDGQAVRQQACSEAKGELKFDFVVTPNVLKRFYKLRVTATEPKSTDAD